MSSLVDGDKVDLLSLVLLVVRLIGTSGIFDDGSTMIGDRLLRKKKSRIYVFTISSILPLIKNSTNWSTCSSIKLRKLSIVESNQNVK